ncbi:phosphoadenosine phosphosulfate reductase family protein [Kitasatospora sp. NPDC002227]|uniref:phosphoadenosine phosphosulfate reductase family protein n=1 Tax=Kitasatospora sp. NPDC002227 TaxID=3154773 RepID=UPI00332F10A9
MPAAMSAGVDLSTADVILLNSSAGKDSQAMLDWAVELADKAGVRDRITVLHCDLGDVEWPGTRELARRQAEHYGLRFEVRHREQGGLLQQIEERHHTLRAKGSTAPAWPSSSAKFCTSDQKRGPARKLITELVTELDLDRPAFVVNGLGLRAAESSARAKRLATAIDPAATSGRRTVLTWHPILDWSDRDVWQRIADSGVDYHPAYDSGMTRLSCSFCILASRADLVTAARLRPAKAAEYLALEQRLGHTFKMGLSMAEIVAEAERLGPLPMVSDGSALRRNLALAA